MPFPLRDAQPGTRTVEVTFSNDIPFYLLELMDQFVDCEDWLQLGNCLADDVKREMYELIEALMPPPPE